MKRVGFLTALALAASVAAGHAAAPGKAPEKKNADPVTSVPLPSKSLVDDPFERLRRNERLGDSPSDKYQSCLDRLIIDANEAFEMASVWRDQGGGAPALHCIALALVELGHYGEAASRLEKLAANPDAGAAAMRVNILSQAGNAWLLQGETQRAIAAFTSGINLSKSDPSVSVLNLKFDRARSYALTSDWGLAVQDLTDVLASNPKHLSALILRATAARHVGRTDQATENIEAALLISPNDPAALIERAIQRMGFGNSEGARQDLVRAAVVGENTPLAEMAQQLIAQLEVGAEVAPRRAPEGRTIPDPAETAAEEKPSSGIGLRKTIKR